MLLAGFPSSLVDLIRDIRDPEHPHTLEELHVVSEDCITVRHHLCSPHNHRGLKCLERELYIVLCSLVSHPLLLNNHFSPILSLSLSLSLSL